MAMLDAHLATRTFMGGERFTDRRHPVGCELHRWFGLPAALYSRPSWPNLERYFAGAARTAGGARRARPGAGVTRRGATVTPW